MKKQIKFNLLRQAVLLFLLMFVGHGTRVYADWAEVEAEVGPYQSIYLRSVKDNEHDYLGIDFNNRAGGKDIYLYYDRSVGTWFYDAPITRIVVLTGSEWSYSNNRTYERDGYTYHPVPVKDGLNGDLNEGAGGDDIFLYYSKDHPENGYISKLHAAFYQRWWTFGVGGSASGKPSYFIDKDLNDGCGVGSDYVYVGAEYHEHTGEKVLSTWLNNEGYLCRGFKDCTNPSCKGRISIKGDGSAEHPIQISSMDDYRLFALYFNDKILPQDSYVELNVDLQATFMDVQQIGYADYPFKGHFNGKGHKLTNNVKTWSDIRIYSGLFAATENASVENMTLIDHFVAGQNMQFIPRNISGHHIIETPETDQHTWGMLTNTDKGSTFRNVHFRNCDFGVFVSDYFGAIAGEAKNTTIEACSFEGGKLDMEPHIKPNNYGLVGNASEGLTIRNSYCIKASGERCLPLVHTFTGSQENCNLERSFTEAAAIVTGSANMATTVGNVTRAQLLSGEATYTMNGGHTNPVWRQRIGTDNMPTLEVNDNSIVYKVECKNCKGNLCETVYRNVNQVPQDFIYHQNIEFVKYYGHSTCLHPVPDVWVENNEYPDYYWCRDCNSISFDNSDFSQYKINPEKIKAQHNFRHNDANPNCKEGQIEHWHCMACNFDFSDSDPTTDDNITFNTVTPPHDLVRVDDTGKRTITCVNPLPLHHYHCNTCGKNYGWGNEEGTDWDAIEIELEPEQHRFTTHQLHQYYTGEDHPEGISLAADEHAEALDCWYCEGCLQWFASSNRDTDEYLLEGEPILIEKHKDSFISGVDFTTDPVTIRGCVCGHDRHYMLNYAGKYSSRIIGTPQDHIYMLQSFDLDEYSPMKFNSDNYLLTAEKAGYTGYIPADREWGTLCLPFRFNTNLVEGVVFYSVDHLNIHDLDGELSLERVSGDIRPGTPLFVWRKSDDKSQALEYTISISYDNPTGDNIRLGEPADMHSNVNAYGTFTGYELNCGSKVVDGETYYGKDYGKNIFYLSGDKLWKATGIVNVKPYRAWLELPNDVNQANLRRMDESVGNGIVDVKSNDSHTIYNLSGQRLYKVTKGVNIIDGKKVMIK